MRNVQRLIAAAVLSCVLALSAFAGHISTPVATPPPPQSPATITTETETATASEAGDSTTSEAPSNSLTEAALNLINSLLALL